MSLIAPAARLPASNVPTMGSASPLHYDDNDVIKVTVLVMLLVLVPSLALSRRESSFLSVLATSCYRDTLCLCLCCLAWGGADEN